MRTHTVFFSCVFVVFLFICLLEMGCKVSTVSATEVSPPLPDFNGDGVINILDVALWARSYHSHPGDPSWNSAADLNSDGVVDVRDAVIMLKDFFGKNCRFYDFSDLSGWNVSGGSWSVQNGNLEGSSSQDGLIYVGDATWKDSVFTAKLKIAGDSAYPEAAVAFVSDTNNFYWAGLGCWGHRISISTRAGGVWRELAFSGDVADVARDVWYVLTVKVSGGTITLYLDDSLELSVNDSTFVSGSVGIRIWGSHVVVDYVTAIGTMTAIGTIDRSVMLLGVGHPSWKYKPDGTLVDLQALVNFCADTGANCWREIMYSDSSVAAGQYYATLKSYCDQRGLKFMIQTASPGGVQPELDIIMNNSGKQTDWINSWCSIIQQVQPYAIMVMNEPNNSNGTNFNNGRSATAEEFAYYRQFCINCVNAWRQIKSDLVVVVNNDPFNDPFDSTSYGFAANPLPLPNIIYGRHIYYSYDGVYPPSYWPDQQAYWNAATAQDLANAKQLLTNLIDRESSALRNKGQQVMWDEWGANIQAPHAANYVQDFYDICKARNIGTLYYDIVPFGYGYSQEPTGLLNNDYTLNAIGQVWAANMH